MDLTRRTFGEGVLGSLLAYSLLDTLLGSDALGDDVKPVAETWLRQVHELSRSVKGGQITQQQWQQQVEQLLSRVNLPDMLRLLDFERLKKTVKYRERGERSLHPKLPQVEGLPTQLVFGHQVFALTKDRSVPPHGHNNMATLFLVLQGEFHGRHYDRLEDDGEHMIIKPSIDASFGAGEYSTVTDFKDNVHWFKASSDTGFIFNIHVLNVDPQVKQGGRVYIDPNGEPLEGGRVRAEKLSASECLKRYG